MSFDSLGLSAELLRAIAAAGYENPTPIQREAIPEVLAGRDLMAGAQTGTGKTAAFALPILKRLQDAGPQRGPRAPRVLVLTPTRELAAQVAESFRTYGSQVTAATCVIFGGVNINPQIAELRRGIDILVATPGRLLDHAGQRTVDLSRITTLVLDEADRMLDMGFIHDIRRVLKLLPAQRQNLLFSATFPDSILDLCNSILRDPARVQVARRNATAEGVSQVAYQVDRERKRELLAALIADGNWRQVLVFTRTKHGANRLAEQLERDGFTAAAIHGNKSQNARTRALAGFKSGDVRVLVATDIAARGIDIDQLPHVVNYDLPTVPEDYVHRIGRTGRAGNEGAAVSLVSSDDRDLLRAIERLQKRSLPLQVMPGFEPGRPSPHAAADGAGRERDRDADRDRGRRDGGRPGQRQPARRHDAREATGGPQPDHARRREHARPEHARVEADSRQRGDGERRGERQPARGPVDRQAAYDTSRPAPRQGSPREREPREVMASGNVQRPAAPQAAAGQATSPPRRNTRNFRPGRLVRSTY
jgi:ATP-dependent RNA helicase RhlE